MANRTVSVRLQAEIGQYVSGMSKAAAATMRVGESATASSKKAQSGFDIAGKGALLMGGAVVAGMGLAISKSMEFEKAMSAVSAATGATSDTLGDLREAAMQAGADTQYSAKEAADAITEMSKAGVSAKDIMGGGLAGALSLAAAGQIEVADAAGIASVAMTQFGLAGKDLPHVADLLAAGAGKAMGSVGDLGAALNQAGLIASAAGLSIEETTGGLAAFASAGLVGSDAGTSFKTMLQALQAPSGKSAELMAELGINMYDANGNMLGLSDMAGVLQKSLGGLTEEQRNAALAQIFGTDAVRAANVLYKEGASGIADWTKKVNDQGYAADQAAKLNDNLAGDLERLGGSFDTLMISFGQGSQGPLRGLVQGLTDLLDAIGGDKEAFESLPGPVQVALTSFEGLADLVGGLATLFGDLPGPMQLAIGAMGLWALAGDKVTGAYDSARVKLQTFREEAALQQALFSQQNTSISDTDRALGGLGTSLDVTGQKFGMARSAISGFAKAIGPSLGVGAAVLGVSQLVEGIQAMGEASDDAKAAAEGLADALTLTDKAADRKSIRNAIEDTDGLMEALDKAGVAADDAIDGLLGQADAQDKVLAALRRYKEEVFAPNGAGGNAAGNEAREALLAYEELTTGYDGAAASARYFASESDAAATGATATGTAAGEAAPQIAAAAAVTEEMAKRTSELGESLADFINPLGAYTAMLDEKAAAEEEAARRAAESAGASADSWRDFVTDTGFSFDEYMRRLEEQVTAQTNWQTNMLILAGRVSSGTLAELSKMGPEGAPLVADLVNRSDAELDRFDEITALRSKEATDAWGLKLIEAGPVLGQISAKLGGGVVAELALKLQAGTTTVEDIARFFGISLANGINPLLAGLGARTVAIQARGSQPNGGSLSQPGFADGGFTGPGAKYQPAGIVHAGEYVLTQEQVNSLGIDAIEAFANRGYANGGFVTSADVPRPPSTAPFGHPFSTAGDATMQRGYDETTKLLDYLNAVKAANEAKAAAAAAAAGPVGSGAVGGGWQSIWNHVKAAIPQARINSTYRAGDPGYHGKGKAIDFGFGSGPGGNGSAGLASINRYIHDTIGGSLAELIYDGIGDDRPDLKNGKPLTYNAATQAEHRNHVHAAVYDGGGVLPPGFTMAFNGTGRNETIRTAGQEAALNGPMQVMLQLDRTAVTDLLEGRVVETLGTRRALNTIQTGLVDVRRERS